MGAVRRKYKGEGKHTCSENFVEIEDLWRADAEIRLLGSQVDARTFETVLCLPTIPALVWFFLKQTCRVTFLSKICTICPSLL